MRSGKQNKWFRGRPSSHEAKRASARVVRHAVRSVLRTVDPSDFEGLVFPVAHQSWDDYVGTALDAGRPCCVVNPRAEQELDRDLYWQELDDQELREEAHWGWSPERIRAIEIEDMFFEAACQERAEKLADLDWAEYDRLDNFYRGVDQKSRWISGCTVESVADGPFDYAQQDQDLDFDRYAVRDGGW